MNAAIWFINTALLLCVIHINHSLSMSYAEWLDNLDETVLKFPPKPYVESLQMPINLKISTESQNEHCVHSKEPYCYPRVRGHHHSECPDEGVSHNCSEVTCANSAGNDVLESHRADPKFVSSLKHDAQPIVSSPDCGLVVDTNALHFSDPTDQPSCDPSLTQPFIIVNVTSSTQSATVSFMVQHLAERATFLNISAISGFNGFQFSTALSFEEDAILNTTYARQAPIEAHYKELLLEHFTLVLVNNGYAIFSGGEVAMTVEVPQDVDISLVAVQFGSADFRGTISDITVYNTAASSSEIYAMYSGEEVAQNQIMPDCTCPREYLDSFGLMKLSVNGTLSSTKNNQICHEGFVNEHRTNQQRFNGNYAGKWNIFTADGWVSDFTDEATVLIKMPQPMLIYSIAGTFGEQIGERRPRDMEIRIIHPSSTTQGAVVYVSKDCENVYNLPTNRFPEFMDSLDGSEVTTRQRRTVNEVSPKCYDMDDVVQASEEMYSFEIPILAPDEGMSLLSDAYVGDISIKLIGHEDATAGFNENWYIVNQLHLHTRPHCGGYNYTLRGAPTTMSEYYNFHKPNARAYNCYCPPGITGDMCETCVEVASIYRYMKQPDVCADCDCSDLIHKNLPQCNRDTGQCNCAGDVDIDLAGRQCHWYISDITPLYGPLAGGTRVVIEGGYLSGYNISFLVHVDNVAVDSVILTERGIEFDTPKFHTAYIEAIVFVTANATLDIGPSSKFFSFEYKPDPILMDIYPNTAILSGGKMLIVKGKFFDSVSFPQLIIYVRRFGEVLDTATTICEVLNSTSMYCPTADLTEQTSSLLYDKTDANTTASEEKYLNGYNGVEFTLGFLFDGHVEYEDLYNIADETLSNQSVIFISDDPQIVTFKEDLGQNVLEFSYKTDHQITIKGERLDYGVSAGDYDIEIGVEYCKVIDLTSNQITCRPPEVQPQVDDNNTFSYKKRYIPHIKVKVGNINVTVGYVYYLTNIWVDNVAFRISMIVLIVIVSLVAVTVLILFLRKKYHQRKMGIQDGPSARFIKHLGEGMVCALFPGQKVDQLIQANVDRCKIPQERLTLGKQIGKGNFGLVYKGQLVTPSGNLRTVAVKTLKEEQEMSFQDMENFLAEGTLMIDFKHENVLSLVGVVAEKGERPLVVLPYMENGDLCTFIRRDDLDLIFADILHFAFQIANGMSYLAEAKFVHRDLAARNCMVDGCYIVKIADFGMSRDVYEKDYYKMESMNKPLPMRWMAVESLKEGRYTSKSDVWSFGITVWELLTRGSSPYPGVNNYYIKEYVSTGKRLDKPSICPPIIYELMCQCWEDSPDNRPTFGEISDFVGKLLRGETIPTPGSDKAAGYCYERKATKHIPDDYLDIGATVEDEDYIIPIDHPVPAPRLLSTSTNVYLNTAVVVETDP